MIKYGLKIWSSNREIIDQAEELIKTKVFDYIELLPVPDVDISSFQEIKASYIIHIPHSKFDFNIADKKKEEFNLKIINHSIECADKLNAKYLILHTGFGSFDTAKKFLKKINDKRIILENMPKFTSSNQAMVGSSPKEIKELKGNKFGFCLDFGHGTTLSKDYKKDIKEFLKLNPEMFHISDGILNNQKDEHYNIGEGDYDIEFMVDCIKKSDSEMATLETPRNNLKSLKEDLINIKRLK